MRWGVHGKQLINEIRRGRKNVINQRDGGKDEKRKKRKKTHRGKSERLDRGKMRRRQTEIRMEMKTNGEKKIKMHRTQTPKRGQGTKGGKYEMMWERKPGR